MTFPMIIPYIIPNMEKYNKFQTTNQFNSF